MFECTLHERPIIHAAKLQFVHVQQQRFLCKIKLVAGLGLVSAKKSETRRFETKTKTKTRGFETETETKKEHAGLETGLETKTSLETSNTGLSVFLSYQRGKIIA